MGDEKPLLFQYEVIADAGHTIKNQTRITIDQFGSLMGILYGKADPFDLLRALLDGDVGRSTLAKLAAGQGTNTDDGRAWLAARALLPEPQGEGK